MRHCRRLLLSLLLTLLLLWGLHLVASPEGQARSAPPTTGQVTWIIDGDSLRLQSGQEVRLLGVDTPEWEASSRDDFYQQWHIPPRRLRRIARQALHYNIHQAKGRQVTLKTGSQLYDTHKRLLAFVYLPDGRMLNRLLLQQGYATAYRRYDYPHKKEFLELEARARKKGRGMWR